MTFTPWVRALGCLVTGLSISYGASSAKGQVLAYRIAPSAGSLPAGSPGVLLSATVSNAPDSLNFNICFATGYGSASPIVPGSFSLTGTSANITFSVPASTIQDVPPSAFASGVFRAAVYAVPTTVVSCSGAAPPDAAVVTLNYPRLTGLSLPSAPQSNPKLSARLPTNITLAGTGFLSGSATAPGSTSTVTFTSNVSVPGAVRPISSTTLVSTIPIAIDPYVPYVKVQVCNTTPNYSYCSNVRNLTLYALPMDDGKVTVTPSSALPTQNVTVSATFGAAAPTLDGVPGGLVTFHYASTVLGSAPLTLDTSGSFVASASTTLQASTTPRIAILADFNQDGVPDLLLREPGSDTLHVVLGSSPSGSFAADVRFAPLASGTTILDAAVSDFNGDGFADIALLARSAGGVTNTLWILLNDGSGNFAAPIAAFDAVYGSHILAADFNHDGFADIAMAGTLNAANATGLQVLLGDGTGRFAAGPAAAGLNTAASASFGGFQIAAADFNGDGFPDIAVLNGASSDGSQVSKSVQLFQNDGKGNFAPTTSIATDGTASTVLSVAALAQGQLPSIILAGSTGFTVALNEGTSAIGFSSTRPFTAVAALRKVVFGDFNGDGSLDAAVDDGTTMHVLSGDSKGGFAESYGSLSIRSGPGSSLVAASDLNLDTYADLVVLSTGGSGAYTLQGYITSGTATASLPPSVFPIGIHNIVARTSGTYYVECASVGTTLTIDGMPTSISITSSVASSITYGQTVTLSAVVADATATGRVSFYNGGELLGTATLSNTTSPTARLTSSALSAGAYALTAVYSGDSIHASATSSVIDFKIVPAAPTLAWPTPASIVAGTALSSMQLDASASGVAGIALPGSFTYTPAIGTIPASGTQTLKVTFAPSDGNDYTTASSSVTLDIVPFTLAALSSDLALLGDPAKTISVSGTGFFSTATVLVGGMPIPTTYVSPTTLTAKLPGSLFLNAHTLQIAVMDSAVSPISMSLPFYVVAPLASVVFTGPTTVVPGTQITLTFGLTNPYPVDLSATFSLGFVPGSGLPSDPNILFASGSSIYTVIIPADSTASPEVEIQTGTIAGAITVGLDLMAGGTDVTPASVKPLNIQSPLSVPVLTSVVATRVGATLTVTMRGFSNTREISQARFHFTPAPGASVATEDVTVPVGPIFATWYADPASGQYGSEFTYSQIFNLTSDATVVQQVTATLVNSVGPSIPVNSP